MALFESVADEYDAGRPAYPAGVFDALGPLLGLRVLDVGAGTGIATRELLARGAMVVALDPGSQVLRRAVARTRRLPAVVGDGAVLPVRDNAVDLITCAQAWHWLDAATRVPEAHRVLRDDGRLAAWWTHTRADHHAWFDRYWTTIEVACQGTNRDQRDTDWGPTLSDGEWFDVAPRIVIPWTRHTSVAEWMLDQSSHSYVAGLPNPARTALLAELRGVLDGEFPDGVIEVPCETWLWIATRRNR